MVASSCIAQPYVIRGSGKVVKGEFDISLDYTSLSVQQGIPVVMVPSEVGVGLISADEKVFDYVSIVENAGKVKVSYQPNLTLHSGERTVVTMPISTSLRWLEASSAGKIESDTVLEYPSLGMDISSAAQIDVDVVADEVDMELSSAAKFRGNVDAGALDMEMSSAAGCEVSGRADHLDVDISSAAAFRGYDLVSKVATVDASSASQVQLTVTDQFTADASSGAAIKYKGTPRDLHPDVSSGGSLRQVD